ncbi:2'-5' RNA ligase family protein [Peribacillus frigoritolerans]|nr:2'-5' RNA ligase family protein [Peribacillus frigoritolerans]
MNTHFFFALVLPDDIKAYLNAVTEQLKTDFPFKKWLHPADYHITMAFLGNAPDTLKEDALGRVESELSNEASFGLELGDIGGLARVRVQGFYGQASSSKKGFLPFKGKSIILASKRVLNLIKSRLSLILRWQENSGDSPFSLEGVRQMGDLQDKHFEADQVALYQTHLGASPSYEKIFTINLQK